MAASSNVLVLQSIELDASSIILNGGKGTSRIQVAKTIKSAKKGERKFDITVEHLDQIVANSARSSQKIPLDYNHLSLNPILPEQAIAAGWFEKLDRVGEKLYGDVEFTEEAARRVQKKEFRYISPVINFKGVNEQGEDIGARLFSAALTIYPFLQGMESVSLTELIADKIVLADLSIDERRARLNQALRNKFAEDYVYIPDNGIYDSYLVYMRQAKCYRLDYKINSDFTVEFSGDPIEVVAQWEPITATEQPSGEVMAENNSKNTDNNSKNTDVVALQEQLATLTTTVNTLKTTVDTAQEDAKKEKERADALQVRLNTQEAEMEVGKLVTGRKIKVDDKAKWVKLYLSNKEMYTELTATLTANPVKLGVEHGSSESDTAQHEEDAAGGGGKDAVVEMTEAVDKYITDNGGKDKVQYGDALRAVSIKNPQLATRYREAFANQAGIN